MSDFNDLPTGAQRMCEIGTSNVTASDAMLFDVDGPTGATLAVDNSSSGSGFHTCTESDGAGPLDIALSFWIVHGKSVLRGHVRAGVGGLRVLSLLNTGAQSHRALTGTAASIGSTDAGNQPMNRLWSGFVASQIGLKR
jgi:hypothetical protein